jgi:hypothetical protein
MYFFAGILFNLTLCMTKLRVLVLSFPGFTDISIETSFCANKMTNCAFSYGRIFALQNNPVQLMQSIFVKKHVPKLPDFEVFGKKSPYYDNRSQSGWTKHSKTIKIFYFPL